MVNEVPMTLIGRPMLPASNFAELRKWLDANKGTGPSMTDLLGGQVDLMCDQTTSTTSQIEAGKVKAFAVTTSKRLTTPALKNLPALDESGLKGFNVSVWQGLCAPKGTPKAVTDKLGAALCSALKDAEFGPDAAQHLQARRPSAAVDLRRAA
jgi:tripartite-type tricarboxylate transporter receptor subunit TctC